MAEETRIWNFTPDDSQMVLEFDILSVLSVTDNKTFSVEKSCESFMAVMDTDKSFPKEYREYLKNDCGDRLNIKKLFFTFRIELLKAISSLCQCIKFECVNVCKEGQEMLHIGEVLKTNLFSDSCDKCMIQKKSGKLQVATGASCNPLTENCSLMFLWRRKISDHMEYPCKLSRQKEQLKPEIIINVDFLPAIEIRRENELGERKHDYFLVPKSCKAEHPTCWKVSHCKGELERMKTTSLMHRQCYMILKFLLDYILVEMQGYKETPTTYILKTAVLTHLRSCTKTDDVNLPNCIVEILEILSESYGNGFLAHAVTGYNLLTPVAIDEMTEVDIVWHRNRSRIMCRYWGFLHKAFENLDDLMNCPYNFDTIQTMVKLIAVNFGRSWTNTDFKIKYVPDEPYFLGFLKTLSVGLTAGTTDDHRRIIRKEGDDSVSWEELFSVSPQSLMRSAGYRMNYNRKTNRDRIEKLLSESKSEFAKQFIREREAGRERRGAATGQLIYARTGKQDNGCACTESSDE